MKRIIEYFKSEEEAFRAIYPALYERELRGYLTFIRVNPTNSGGKNALYKDSWVGCSDFIIFFKGGIVLFLEIKSLNDQQRLRQKAYERKLKRLGYKYMIVSTYQKFYYLLEEIDNLWGKKKTSNKVIVEIAEKTIKSG